MLAVLVVVSFSQFGLWQLRRYEQRQARDAVIAVRLAAPAVDLDVALAAAQQEVADGATPADAFMARRVRTAGTFEPHDEVLRRPVSRDGRPGYHVVTPLALADGAVGMVGDIAAEVAPGRDGEARARLWVERGWVPQAIDQVPVDEAPPPAGDVVVEGWLRAPDVPPTGWVASLAPRDPPAGRLTTVAYLDVARLADQVGGPTVNAVLMLASTQPPTDPNALPLAPQPLAIGPGPHLGYAIQWFAFTLVVLIGYPALLRRSASERRAFAEPPT